MPHTKRQWRQNLLDRQSLSTGSAVIMDDPRKCIIHFTLFTTVLVSYKQPLLQYIGHNSSDNNIPLLHIIRYMFSLRTLTIADSRTI